MSTYNKYGWQCITSVKIKQRMEIIVETVGLKTALNTFNDISQANVIRQTVPGNRTGNKKGPVTTPGVSPRNNVVHAGRTPEAATRRTAARGNKNPRRRLDTKECEPKTKAMPP